MMTAKGVVAMAWDVRSVNISKKGRSVGNAALAFYLVSTPF
jgi:hypothetical protein